MSDTRGVFRPLGVLAMLVSEPMLKAGFAAMRPLLDERISFRFVVGAMSIAAALLLLVAGIVLCLQKLSGRTLVYVSAAISVPVCVMGAAIGLMGGHALLYGLAHPTVIVLLVERALPPTEPRSNEAVGRVATA